MTARKELNKWYQTLWLPSAAAVYLIICIFDFLIMPIYTAEHNARIENRIINAIDIKDAVTFADTLVKSNQATRQWNPLTLLGGGMFHLAFGALLTGGAVTRGFAKRAEIDGYYQTMGNQQMNGMGYGMSNSMYGMQQPQQYGNMYQPNQYSQQNPQYMNQQPQQMYPSQQTDYDDDGPQPKTTQFDTGVAK